LSMLSTCFNPRSRAGSDSVCLTCQIPHRSFNPRSRAGSDPVISPNSTPAILFQSTLPRGERLLLRDGMADLRLVSIHAPARGATTRRGVSLARFWFQSTLPRGERLPRPQRPGDPWSVSIHAPARGATSSPPIHTSLPFGFNPRSRAGSDSPAHKPGGGPRRFQSTLPRGERLEVLLNSPDEILFQSTLPRGERLTHEDCMGK